MPKFVYLHHCYIALRSRSKVGVKGQHQGHGSRSMVKVKFLVRSSRHFGHGFAASAAMSNNHHYQSKVIVCVSVISGRLQIIVRMRSIGC